MFQRQKSVQIMKAYSSHESAISEDDLSITSFENNQESYDELTEGFLSQFNTLPIGFDETIFPDAFKQYRKQLINMLNKFISSFVRLPLSKIINYQLNISLVLCQVSYKIGKLMQIEDLIKDAQLQNSFKLFSYYLNFHAISNLYKIKEIVRILIKKIDIMDNYNFSEYPRKLFKQILSQSELNQDDGIFLLKQIEGFICAILEKCEKMSIAQQNLINHLNINLFPQISIIDFIIKTIKQSDSKQSKFTFLQSKFGSLNVRKQFTEKTKIYVSKFYKKIYQFFQANNNSRLLKELLFYFILIKIVSQGSQDFPIKMLRFIDKQKKNLLKYHKFLEFQSYFHFIINSNIHFRAELPRIHFLLKNKGFIKLCSFLHEASLQDIQNQIGWTCKANQNLKS